MKNFLLALPFLFVVLSAASGAEGEALDTPWAQAILPQALSEQQLLVTAAAAGDITSLVLRHIANVTASLTEEYLKGLVALGTEVLLVSITEHFNPKAVLRCLCSSDQWIRQPFDTTSKP